MWARRNKKSQFKNMLLLGIDLSKLASVRNRFQLLPWGIETCALWMDLIWPFRLKTLSHTSLQCPFNVANINGIIICWFYLSDEQVQVKTGVLRTFGAFISKPAIIEKQTTKKILYAFFPSIPICGMPQVSQNWSQNKC